MTKQTKTILVIGGLSIVGYLLWKSSNSKKNANGMQKLSRILSSKRTRQGTTEGGCSFQGGSCVDGSGNLQPVGTILDGNRIIVSNSSKNCLVCPQSSTDTGLPIGAN
jgi:hypothetical protein